MNQTSTIGGGSSSNCCSCYYTSVSVINMTNSTAPPADTSMFLAGLGLSLGSCLFVGTSYVVSRKALCRYQRRMGTDGYSGLGCMREGLWWLGLLLLGVGELGNFLAFGFAPASLVTPLEGLAVVVSVIMARVILKERLNVHGQVGILLSLLGAVIIVLLAPENKSFTSLAQLASALLSASFIAPACVLVVLIIVGAAWLAPRWGDRNPFVFLFIAASAGPITVFGCKAIGLAISDTVAGSNQFGYWLTWFMIIVLLGGVSTQLYYINRSLAVFPTNVVTPINFVLFTSFVLVVSGIAFNEFSQMDAIRVIVMVCGFVVIAVGVIVISVFKDEDCDWKKVSKLLLKSTAATPAQAGDNSSQTQDENQVATESGNVIAIAGGGRKKQKRTTLNLRKFRMKSDPMKKRRLDGDEEERNSNSYDDIHMSAATVDGSISYVNHGLTPTDERVSPAKAKAQPPPPLPTNTATTNKTIDATATAAAADEQQNGEPYTVNFVCTSPSSSSASSPSSSSEQDWGLSNQPVGYLAM